MENQVDMKSMHEKIQQIKHLFNELQQDISHFPAINRNTKRALASLKMLELNISDLVEFELLDNIEPSF